MYLIINKNWGIGFVFLLLLNGLVYLMFLFGVGIVCFWFLGKVVVFEEDVELFEVLYIDEKRFLSGFNFKYFFFLRGVIVWLCDIVFFCYDFKIGCIWIGKLNYVFFIYLVLYLNVIWKEFLIFNVKYFVRFIKKISIVCFSFIDLILKEFFL